MSASIADGSNIEFIQDTHFKTWVVRQQLVNYEREIGTMNCKWILIKKLAEISGYSEKAIRGKIEKGVWVQGIQWRYSPDNRIQFNIEEYQKWVERDPTRASKRGRPRSSSISTGDKKSFEDDLN